MPRIDTFLPGWQVSSFSGLKRPEWMGLRQEDVTASEVGCLFGDLRYLTPLALYHRKRIGEVDNPNAAMMRGRIMEPAAARMVSMDLPDLQVETREGSYLRLRTADPHVRLGATKDYQARVSTTKLDEMAARIGMRLPESWLLRDELSLALELKTVAKDAFHAHWGEGPPRQYVLQGLTQAMLGGDDGALLVAMVITPSLSLSLVVYPIPRSFDAELGIVDKVRSFWEDFEAQRIPQVDARDNSLVGEVYPAQEGQVADLSKEPEWAKLLEERETDSALVESLTHNIHGIEARLKQRMGTAQEAKIPGWSVSWRQNKRARPLVIKRWRDKT